MGDKKFWLPYGRRCELDQLYDEIFSGFPMSNFFSPLTFLSRLSQQYIASVRDTEEKYFVEVELPGFDKGEISIKTDENTLEILAKHEEGIDGKKQISREMHRRYGFPKKIVGTEAEASYKNGILEITLPKLKPFPKEEKVTKVNIK